MLYFDEAGNSGDNLLDSNQPSYLLLSHDFTNQETLEILQPLLSVSKAKELHFKEIKKYSSSRNNLIRCLNNKLIQEGRIYYYVAHKEFMIVAQMVDKLIEPVLYAHGIDIYVEGLNISTANILYIMGTTAWDKVLFSKMCEHFVKWVRSSLIEDCIQFYNSVKALYVTLVADDDKNLLSLILSSEFYIADVVETFEKYSMDATLSCLVAHCHHWSKKYLAAFDITFDSSKQIDYWRGMIDFLTKELPEAEVGFGSRKHKYPLLINSLSTADSEKIKQIQLADLLASSINYVFINKIAKTENGFANEILKSNLGNISGNSIWPSNLVTPEQLDMVDSSGQNALDFIAEIAMQKPDAYKKVNQTKKR